jgi:hypothetical protein
MPTLAVGMKMHEFSTKHAHGKRGHGTPNAGIDFFNGLLDAF